MQSDKRNGASALKARMLEAKTNSQQHHDSVLENTRNKYQYNGMLINKVKTVNMNNA